MTRLSARALLAGALAIVPAFAAAATEDLLRASWVGRWVLLRTAAISNCDERYTDNRMRGTQPASGGRHRFDAGEIGRVDNLHLQRSRIDLLVSLAEPLRVALRDGPFEIHEQLECRVELELPVPREAVRRKEVDRLDRLVQGVLEGHGDRGAAQASPLWNRRRGEPLPDDHAERLAAYRAWKEEQVYIALRERLAEALDRAAEIASRADRDVAYARGLVAGARDYDADRVLSTACGGLPQLHFSSGWGSPPAELDGDEERDWKDGFADGRRLRFEIALARRIERCLP